MKKLTVLLFFLVFLISACLIGTTNEGHFDDMLQGSWYINHEQRNVTFDGNTFRVNDDEGKCLFDGQFTNDAIPDSPPMWIWESNNVQLSVTWQSCDTTGQMRFIDAIGDCEQKVLVVSGFPFSQNSIDTLREIIKK